MTPFRHEAEASGRMALRNGLVPLDAVLCTEESIRHSGRAPDFETENRALSLLVQALADSPATISQKLAATLMEVLQAGSAGISLLAPDGKSFYRPAIAGAWRTHAGAGIPRDFSPDGDALDCNAVLVFRHPERHYPCLAPMLPPAQEFVLLPFQVNGQAVGTIWAVTHDAQRRFDAEDLRQLTSLGRIASAACQTAKLLGAALEQDQRALDLKDEALQARQAMEKLRESEEHYRLRFESLEEGFCVIEKLEGATLDFRYVEANPTFAALTQLGDVVGKTVQQVLPNDFADRLLVYDTVCRTGEPVRLQRAFGNAGRVLELYAFRVEDETKRRVAINLHDITAREQARALAASQARELAVLYATAPVGLFMFDARLRFVRVNQTMADLNGLPAAQHIGRTLRELLSPELADNVEPLLRQVFETGQSVMNQEVCGATLPRPEEQRYWLVSYHPVQALDGEISGVHGVVQEITQRKQSEQALRESQRFLRSSLDALSGHVAVLDESGTILEINEAWRQFGAENNGTAGGIGIGVGVNYLQCCEGAASPDGQTSAYVSGIQDVIAGRRARFEMEYPCHSLTEKRWFVMRANRFRSPGPIRIVIVHDDCTERKLAEEALNESQERYRHLFYLMDEGFCLIELIFDAQHQAVDCRFLEVNPAFAKQTGMHDVTGKRLRDIAPQNPAGWLAICGKLVRSGQATRFTYEEKGAKNYWFDIYAARLGSQGAPKIAIVFNNITHSKRADDALRQSEQRFRALFDLGPVAMYCCDLSGAIQEFNSCAVGLWGREPSQHDARGRCCGALNVYLPDGSPLDFAQNPMVAVLKGEIPEARDVEAVIERPDGSRITVIANIVPLRNARGHITGAINCFYDITERSRLERQTQEQAQTLADLHQRKDEFLAMLSHELRNPLAPLSSAVQLLQLQKNDDPVQRQARNVIERQVTQLTVLVNDLLEVSRITTGKIQLRKQRIGLAGVVERAVETVQPLIMQRRHRLTLSLPQQPVWLDADPARLEQVLVNLLTNAAKYTDEGGRLWLSVEQEANAGPDAEGAVAVITVRDSGIGIAPELLPHIFDLFTQAERTLDRSQGGLGIGLCLVQRVVELHAGSIKVHSVPGQGSEFEVRLPVMAQLPPVPQPSIKPALPPGKGCRVLAVDDNVDAVRSLAMLLEMSGHEVQIAYDGPSALEMAAEMVPDVILLDIGLPGLTGYEVAEQIRLDSKLRHIVLVALTGYGRPEDRQFSHDVGFDYHLVKPADFGEVQKILAIVSAQVALPRQAAPPGD